MLGMGIVSAQTNPTFSYQSVVVDNNGDLVVDATVDAHVIITYTGGNYEEVHQGVTTSQNGMIILPIGGGNQVAGGDFGDINWKTATIAVSYTAPNRTISNSNATSVNPVPYAVQADGFVFNTPAITSYLSNSNTNVQDLYDIIAAVVSNPNDLSEDLKQALIDSLIANRLIAKDIMLYYIEHATVDDVQALYNALDGNEVAKRVMTNLIVDYIKQHRNLVVEVLRDYVETMTPAEMNALFAAVPADVKTAIVNYGYDYATSHKSTVIYPILMEYVSTITTDEFAAAVQALQANTASFQLVWDQFNAWMAEYFTGSGAANHVESIIEEEIAKRPWVENCPGHPVDICDLADQVEELEEAGSTPVCPTLGQTQSSTQTYPQENMVVLTLSNAVNGNILNIQDVKYKFFLAGDASDFVKWYGTDPEGGVHIDTPNNKFGLMINLSMSDFNNVRGQQIAITPICTCNLQNGDPSSFIYGDTVYLTVPESDPLNTDCSYFDGNDLTVQYNSGVVSGFIDYYAAGNVTIAGTYTISDPHQGDSDPMEFTFSDNGQTISFEFTLIDALQPGQTITVNLTMEPACINSTFIEGTYTLEP